MENFSVRLQSLRGVAALMVALAHSMGAIAVSAPIDVIFKKILNVLGNGGTGVTIFFILSGHVLGSSLLKSDQGHDSSLFSKKTLFFMFRRLFRIYPLMVVSLAACALYLHHVHVPIRFSAASPAYYHYWHSGASFSYFFNDLLLTNNYLNPVIWTLQVELIGAFLMPLFFYLKSRHPGFFYLTLIAWIAYFYSGELYGSARSGFVFMFLLGLCVSDIARLLLQARLSGRSLIWIAGFAFFAACVTNLFTSELHPTAWLIEALFATLLLAAILTVPLDKNFPVLDTRLSKFMGNISYGFYLWHFPVLYIFFTFFGARINNDMLLAAPNTFMLLMFALTTIITVPVAWLTYVYVEKPFVALGRRWFV